MRACLSGNRVGHCLHDQVPSSAKRRNTSLSGQALHGSSAQASPGALQGQQSCCCFPEKEHLDFPWHVGLCCSAPAICTQALLCWGQRRGGLCKAGSVPSMLQQASDSIQLLTGKNKEKDAGCKRASTKVRVPL